MKKSYYVPPNVSSGLMQYCFLLYITQFFCNPLNEYNSQGTLLWCWDLKYILDAFFFGMHVFWCVWIRNNFWSYYFCKKNQELSFVLKQPINPKQNWKA